MTKTLHDLLEQRFGAPVPVSPDAAANETLQRIAGRGSCRSFKSETIPADLIHALCAVSLCAPAKSDLQQRDIIIIEDKRLRQELDGLLTGGSLGQPWVAEAPHLLVFCGNNRRQRQLHKWRGRPFANDHLDAFYNAALDAGIAMATFVTAAEAVGLGCCPVSAIRNDAAKVSDLLALLDHVFPAVALALGWPDQPPPVSLRLPLSVTVHRDRFSEDGVETAIATYDKHRAAVQPYAAQRHVDAFGTAPDYAWSEDKARQYAKPERASFGAFIRAKGFDLR